MSLKVFISTSTFAEIDLRPLEKLKKQGLEVTRNPYQRRLSKEEALRLYPQYDGLIAGLELLDREVLQASRRLKVISRSGAGMSNVDMKAARELGIKVFNTPLAPTNAVAELTIGGLLSVQRHIAMMDAAMHQGRWEKNLGCEVKGKTVTIIGCGNIGQRVAALLEPFGVRIIVVDIKTQEKCHYEQMSLKEALGVADIVTLHCSGETCLLGVQEFSWMKKGVVILNAARGGLIDEKALVKALDAQHVRGAWLDTFELEPYQGPLLQYPQVVMTPHVGSYTRECRSEMEMEAVNNLIAGFRL
ncbi:MAG: phosphoglycerate dehydrogenase [Candidatus Omnitrophica bacterium]|nr:phosphoglycerate dehydrogenase [Candidatus Omnitrophota bacterium]